MKRRILFALLAIVIVISMLSFASCGGDDKTTTTEPQTTTAPTTTTAPDATTTNTPGSSVTTTGPSQGGDNVVTLAANTPLKVEYLRIVASTAEDVTFKFNAPYYTCSFDVRFSDEVITEDNFNDAAKADVTITGESVGKTAVVKNITAALDKAYYVAIKPYNVNGEGTATYGDMVTIRVGGSQMLPIEYNKIVNGITVHHGENLRDLSKLFDEQNVKNAPGSLLRPTSTLAKLYSESDDETNNGGQPRGIYPIIDLEYLTYVDKVCIYINEVPSGDIIVRTSNVAVDFLAADRLWDTVTVLDSENMQSKKWYTVDVSGVAEYVQVSFIDGSAPVEIMVYGYQCGESDHAPSEESHKLPTVGEMMGMCGFVAVGGGNTTIAQVSCTTVLREYHNFGWTYRTDSYPKTASRFSGDMGNFDAQYQAYSQKGINVIPCIQWSANDHISSVFELDADGKVVRRDAVGDERYDPNSYQTYADNMFSFAGRFGTTKSDELKAILTKHNVRPIYIGRGTVTWLELGNEPNGEGNDGFTPYQLAALTSAGYDGHCNTMVDPLGESDHFGAKNADPNMKVAMAGLAGIGSRYISSMIYWMKANRDDGKVAMDAFNVHSYFCREFKINGQGVMMGVSPEEFGLIDELSPLLELRDKYYPEKEVWLTEFSWDTATSYTTKTACHAYGEYTARQVQAMWLTRAYLLMSAAGVDKATMYMCEDGTSEETTENVKYGTCGVFDHKGNKKDSFFYLYTLKNTLGAYTFVQEIDSGRSDVWIYQFADAEGNYGYALWCPTSDGTKVNDFKLYIDADNAVLVENVYGEEAGVKTNLTANDKVVSVNVSENPVYVMVSK